MRRFVDDRGRSWDVVVGRESWGAMHALFIPAGAGRRESVRQAILEAAAYHAAQLELAELDEGALAALFERSTPKET